MAFNAKQRLAGECSHQEYYSQFVNKTILNIVRRSIGEDKIRESTDFHLNDIPIKQWERLPIKLVVNAELFKRLNNVTYAEHERHKFIWSIADGICIAKAAARMIKDELCKTTN